MSNLNLDQYQDVKFFPLIYVQIKIYRKGRLILHPDQIRILIKSISGTE